MSFLSTLSSVLRSILILPIIESKQYPDIAEGLYVRVCGNQKAYDNLTEEMQVAFCIDIYEMEVNNGGFQQFFTNSTGFHTLDVLNTLRLIKAHENYLLLNKAIGIAYRQGFPSDRNRHEDDIGEYDEIADELYELDKVFYNSQEHLGELVNEFIAKKT